MEIKRLTVGEHQAIMPPDLTPRRAMELIDNAEDGVQVVFFIPCSSKREAQEAFMDVAKALREEELLYCLSKMPTDDDRIAALDDLGQWVAEQKAEALILKLAGIEAQAGEEPK